MEIEFSPRAKQELVAWRLAGKTNILQKVRELIESILETPFEGIGKPEALNMAFRENGADAYQKRTGWYIA